LSPQYADRWKFVMITFAKRRSTEIRDILLRLTVAIWNAPNYCTQVERGALMVAQAAPWFRSIGVRFFRDARGAASPSAAVIREW
jgi:hypothetical protein